MSPANPYVGAAGSFASSAAGAYAAGLQFATALRTAAAQQQAHQDMLRQQAIDNELKMRKEGGTPMMLPGPTTSSGLKRRDPDPQFAGPEHAGHMQSDTLGRAWHMPTELEQAAMKLTPQQTYADEDAQFKEGNLPLDASGNVRQLPWTPRLQSDEQGNLRDTGLFGVNVPPPVDNRLNHVPGGRTFYQLTPEEKAKSKLHQDLEAENAKEQAKPGATRYDSTSFFDTATGEPATMLINEKTGQSTRVTLPEGIQHVEKPEPASKYSTGTLTDDRGVVRKTRTLNSDPEAVPEWYNAATKKWETVPANNHFGKSKTEPFVIPGLGGKDGAAGPGAQLTGDEYLKTLPAGTAAQVKAMAEGRLTIPSASRSPAAIQLRSAVLQYDPTYSDQRAQIRREEMTGPGGRNNAALNTATVHLDQLVEASRAMKNGTWQPGNDVYNYVAEKFGKAAPNNYRFVMNALAGEGASALKGNATDPEIAHVLSSLKPGMSPEQAEGVGITGLHVFGTKLQTALERHQQLIPNDKVYTPMLPSARAVFAKYGIGLGQQGGPAGGGANPNPGGYVVNHVYGGMTYLGGDVNNPASWKKK